MTMACCCCHDGQNVKNDGDVTRKLPTRNIHAALKKLTAAQNFILIRSDGSLPTKTTIAFDHFATTNPADCCNR